LAQLEKAIEAEQVRPPAIIVIGDVAAISHTPAARRTRKDH
jgi:siroheme synthase